ncbi:MAG: hypothetical protein HYW04_03870 [Deltaproteobacteria bacterium]|nr:hypothetical protein [Deltaproteobacteria bacterium]
MKNRQRVREGGMAALVVFASLAVALGSALAAADGVLEDGKSAQVVSIVNLKVEGGVVSGELVNRSKWPLREVQLFIRYIWQWKSEFKPGEDVQGRAVYHTVEREIAPGGKVDFTYRPSPPLPSRADGYFETSVTIAGFSEVIE